MTDMLTLKCPACGGRGHMIEGTNRFHCDYCGTDSLIQLSYTQAPPAATPASDTAEEVIRPNTPIPSTIRTEQDGDGSRIIQRWFTAKYVFMAFFCVVWDGFICFWYSMVFGGMSSFGAGGPGLIFALFPLLHVGVGVYLTYSTLAGFLNRTTVELTHDTLAVFFDPLPWPGEKKIPTNTIKQLYAKEIRKRTKNGANYTYDLYAVTYENQQVKILSGLDSPELARYFEQQVESWLNIKDQRVLGELD